VAAFVNVKKEFGVTLRAYRLLRGMSQQTLAQRAALHRTYVTDVERGARNVSLESISRLASALNLTISALFTPPTQPSSDRKPGHELGADHAHILLVEDDPRDVELTLAAFRTARLCNPVQVVRDGVEALEFLFRECAFAAKDRSPASLIVFLDVRLPKISGLEVLKQLRADPRTRSLQVVMLTASTADADARAALRLGADAYVVKPLDFQTFSSLTPRLNLSWTLSRGPSLVSGRRTQKKASV